MRKEFITPQIVLKMLRQENELVAARAACTHEIQSNRRKLDNSTKEKWTTTNTVEMKFVTTQ